MVRNILSALVCVLATGGGVAAVAGPFALTGAVPRYLAERGPDLTHDEAAAIARAASGGRVLGVERAVINGRPVYRVKVLTSDGLVRVLRVDGRTGAVD